MDKKTIGYACFGVGLVIVALSWARVVSNEIGWVGWGIGMVGVVLRRMR